MTNLEVVQSLQGNSLEHPAVRAWNKLHACRCRPAAIETLKRNKKSAIYRLTGIGPGGFTIIAKRCQIETGVTERIIYEQILPRLALPALRFFGWVEAQDIQFCWLFLEDAGQEFYSPALDGHRAAVARWLAHLHTSAPGVHSSAPLPDRGSRFYREQMRQASDNLVTAFSHPALKADQLDVLKGIAEQCCFLESRWSLVEALCAGVPETFVHGDLKAKNLRVRQAPDGIAVLVFDWEIAGWGVPAVDLLKCPELPLYLAEAQKSQPALTLPDLRRLADVGALFRALIAVYWKSLALSYEWVEWPVDKLRLYRAKVAECIQSLCLE